MNDLIIYGAGGSARETAWLAQSHCSPEGAYRVAAFIDDDPARDGDRLNGIPVMRADAAVRQFPRAGYVVGVGNSADRERLASRIEHAGLRPVTLVHPHVERSETVSIGPGCVICAGCIVTVNVRIGAHVQINIGCTISHDVAIEDFSTFAPGVHVSGWVHIGKRVHLGTGAVILNGRPDHVLTIGDDAIVGAGAVVTRAVLPGITVAGVPARPIKRTDSDSTPPTSK